MDYNKRDQVAKALLAAADKLEGSVWYHTTPKENAEKILKEGLKVNQKPTYSQASLSYMKDAYGAVPIFLAKSPEPYDGDSDGVVLAVDVSGLKLAADIPTLASHFGAYLDEDGIYFEEGEDRVPPEFAEEEHISFDDLVDGWAAPIAVELTGTAAVLKNIPSSRISSAEPHTQSEHDTVSDGVYYHGSPHKIDTLRSGAWVTPHKEDAHAFGIPWDSNDLTDRGNDINGRPPLFLKFKPGREPNDSPLYVYEVSGPTKPADTNTGKRYSWNRQTTMDLPVKLVAYFPSWRDWQDHFTQHNASPLQTRSARKARS